MRIIFLILAMAGTLIVGGIMADSRHGWAVSDTAERAIAVGAYLLGVTTIVFLWTLAFGPLT